jgi:hypothetical protein|tara:strand:+ start:4161 stop:4775 length:615 start_codon:yes stop_codon:yes gene_type:complete
MKLNKTITKFDYASPTQFKFTITKLPKVEFFCTAVNLPGISLEGTMAQPTPLKDIPVPGDKLSYSTLNMDFMVDENLENYREIHGWLTGLGFPKDRQEFRNLLGGGADRFPTSTGSNQETDAGKIKYKASDTGAVYSDATLSILTSKNTTNIQVRFSDIFPTSLSGLNYNQQQTDVNYLIGTVTFQYKIYEFAEGSGQTSVTVS